MCVKTFVDIPKHPEHQSSHSIYIYIIYMFSWDAPLIHFWIFFGNTRKMKNGTRKGLWNLMNEHHSGQEHQQFYKTTHTVLMTCFPNALNVGLLTQKQLWFFIFLTRPFYFLGWSKGLWNWCHCIMLLLSIETWICSRFQGIYNYFLWCAIWKNNIGNTQRPKINLSMPQNPLAIPSTAPKQSKRLNPTTLKGTGA